MLPVGLLIHSVHSSPLTRKPCHLPLLSCLGFKAAEAPNPAARQGTEPAALLLLEEENTANVGDARDPAAARVASVIARRLRAAQQQQQQQRGRQPGAAGLGNEGLDSGASAEGAAHGSGSMAARSYEVEVLLDTDRYEHGRPVP